MRVNRRLLMFAGNVVLVAVILVLVFWESDEDAIRRQLDRLAATVSKQADAPPLAVVGRSRTLEDLFTVECRIEAGDPVPSLRGRRELLSRFQALWTRMGTVTVSWREVTLQIGPDGETAQMTATAVARGRPRGTEREEIVRPLELTWQVDDGDWRIASIRLRETSDAAED